jgi:cell division cycle protein 20 (cofactor of APC complex)
MVRSGDTTLGEIPSNGAEGGQARKSSGSGNSLKGIKPKSHRFDDDVLPSSRITRIEVTQDWEGSATDSRHIKRTSSSHSTNIGRGDRYIPNRDLSRSASLGADHLRDSIGGEALSSGSTSARASSPADNNITSSSNSLDDGEEQENRGPSDLGEALQMERCHQILSFNAMAPDSASAPEVRSRYAVARPKLLPSSLTSGGRRRIATTPEKTLDTPDMRDDFYSHLLSWSSQNVVAVALGSCVHTWNGNTGDVSEVCDLAEMTERVGGGDGSYVKTLTWDESGTLLQVGTQGGYVQIWDLEKGERVRTFKPSADGSNPADNTAVTTSSWAEDGTLALGYWSGLLREHDLRQRNSIIRDINNAHTQSICGMKYRADSGLLATGGNDNVVKVWDRRTTTAKMQKERHRAAVRALSWSPLNSSLLATGGGTMDKMIHFWNVTQGTRLQSIQTDSQITALHWSQRYKEIVSCHGTVSTEGCSPSYINIWSYPSLEKLESFEAHESRTLHSALSPDGQVLATCSTDESLKFWRIFEVIEEKKNKSSNSIATSTSMASHTKGGVKKLHSLR